MRDIDTMDTREWARGVDLTGHESFVLGFNLANNIKTLGCIRSKPRDAWIRPPMISVEMMDATVESIRQKAGVPS